jgi:hypothetical protein
VSGCELLFWLALLPLAEIDRDDIVGSFEGFLEGVKWLWVVSEELNCDESEAHCVYWIGRSEDG